MATSAALNTSNGNIKYQIIVTEGTVDVANNLSPVTVSVRFYRTNTGYTSYGTGTVYCKIDGTTYSAAVTPSQKITNSGIVLFTKTLNIQHDDDGGKTLPVTAWISHDVVTSSEQGFNVELTTIARASQPSCVTWPEHTKMVGEFGDTISIHMNRKSDNFLHTVHYVFGTIKGTIATDVDNGTTWTIPMSLMNYLPNYTRGSFIIYVDTYNGTQLVGTKSCEIYVDVPASVKPTCSIQVLDATDTKDTYGNLVKGQSKLYVKTTGTPAYSSPIASYNIVANGNRYTAEEITTGLLTEAGTTTVTATVTDKRGRTSAEASASFPVLDYSKPTISSLSVHRCDENGTEDDQGEYVQVTFSAAITPLNNKNSAAYSLKYKKTDEDTYTTVPLDDLAGDYTVTDYSYIFAADSDNSYDITVEAEDDFGSVPLSTSASTAFTFMDWNDDGKSIAFGKVSEESGALENALTLKQIGNRFAFSTPGVAGSAGYICMAQLTHVAANADTPITFVFTRRLEATPMTVHVQFRTDSTTVDPQLQGITYEGSNYGAFLVKSAESVWDLYVQKVSAYDTITLQDWYTTRTIKGRLNVTFPGILVDELPAGLLGWYRATPAKLQSLLDFIYPVGSIYLSYSHVSPATLFGGTWERIQNAFLWATDEKGEIGQTGGEKTHTLTEAEMPKHTHYDGTNANWGLSGTSVDTYVTTAQISFNAASGRPTTETGGGQAHNNMPPYIQVSAWRRTA